MVLAALCEQYLPSHRGLARDHQSLAAANDRLLWQQHHYQHSERENRTDENNNNNNNNNNSDYRRNSILDLSQPENENENKNQNKSLPNAGMPLAAAATRRKRNRCKASKLLASCAADFDVLTDWLFYAHIRHENAEYFQNEGNQESYKIPPWMTGLVLASCLVGTTLWLVLATDGAIATPILRFFGYDKLSLGHILLASVVFEDLPQVVLTFYIEDYFEEDQEFNNYAVVNVVASLYDILIKLAEAYDQRADIVETGHWCKDSIPAHSDKILCLVPIPQDSDEEHSGGGSVGVASVSNRDSTSLRSNLDSSFRSNGDSGSFRFTQDPEGAGNGGSSPSLFRNKLHVSNQAQHGQRRRRTLLQEAQEMIADTKLPPVRFLSASKEGSVKLWDTSANDIGEDQSRVPSEIFEGHGKRVSCISFVRKVGTRESDVCGVEPTSMRDLLEDDETKPLDSKEKTKHSYYFLTGSYDGTSKLWKTSETQCIKTYKTLPFGNESALEIEVTSIAYMDCTDEGYIQAPLPSYVSPPPLSSARTTITRSEYFVNGYKSGKVRLWDMWSGACLKIFEEKANPSKGFFRAYRKKKSRIYSLCSMEDAMHFVAGSMDGSIKMWELGIDDHDDGLMIAPIVEVDTDKTDQTGSSKAESTSSTITIRTTATPAQVFIGHTAAVFSIQCVSPGSVLVSGSEDKTARLWSVSTGACLKTFDGHTGPIHDVAIVDQVTFLTASSDKTIRAWDVVSGDAFRTYENSSAAVTAVVTGDQSGCFLSGDEKGKVGLWIFSAVHDEHHRANRLGIDDDVDLTMCGGCQGDVEMVSEEIDAAQGYRRIT